MKERGRDGPVPSTDSKEASGLDKKKGSKNLTTVQETEEETEVGEQRGQGVTTLDKFNRRETRLLNTCVRRAGVPTDGGTRQGTGREERRGEGERERERDVCCVLCVSRGREGGRAREDRHIVDVNKKDTTAMEPKYPGLLSLPSHWDDSKTQPGPCQSLTSLLPTQQTSKEPMPLVEAPWPC